MQILLAFSPHKIGFLSTRGRFPILPPMGGGLRLGPRKRILPVFWPGGLASATTRWPTSKRKESGHGKTHGRQGKRPHRVPTRLRKVSHPDRNRTRTPRFDGLARDPEPPDRQRETLRVLQQALQPLPQKLRALLRSLPAFLRGQLRALGEVALRLQRMRKRTPLPAPQEVLPRRGSAGQLRRSPAREPSRRPRRRHDVRGDGRGRLPRRQEGPVRAPYRREQPRTLQGREAAHRLRLDRRGSAPREEA